MHNKSPAAAAAAADMWLCVIVQVVWFEGGYSEYEADRRKRTGNAGPTPVKYRKLALA